MVCIICKKNEDQLKKENSLEIDDINNVISIIKDKINKPTAAQESKTENDKNYKNCMGDIGKYCLNCDFVESVDDKDTFWCKTYKKTFSSSMENNIKTWNKEIEVLQLKCKEIGNINFETINIPEQINSNEKYNKIMQNYLPEYSKHEQHSSVCICNKCNLFLNNIIEDKLNDLKDDIIDTIRNEIDEDDED